MERTLKLFQFILNSNEQLQVSLIYLNIDKKNIKYLMKLGIFNKKNMYYTIYCSIYMKPKLPIPQNNTT